MDGLSVIASALALGLYVLVVWRAPPQQPPQLSHSGLRWRLWHSESLRPWRAVPMVGVLAMFGTSWFAIAHVLMALAWRSGAWGLLEIDFDAMEMAPLLGALVSVVVVPWVMRSHWTGLEADPTEVRLHRPLRRPRTIPWSQVQEVRQVLHSVVFRTPQGEIRLYAPQAEVADLQRAAAWMAATAAAPAEPVRIPPAPDDLRRLMTDRN